jgi:hypothetical protein
MCRARITALVPLQKVALKASMMFRQEVIDPCEDSQIDMEGWIQPSVPIENNIQPGVSIQNNI